jgi:hypothetical protein
MTLARYLLGLASMFVALVPVVVGARGLRRRYLPELLGAAAWLADAVVSIAIVVVASEVLGTVGLFALLPVMVTFAGAGLIAGRIAARGGQNRDATLDEARVESPAQAVPDRAGRWGTFAAIAAIAVVAAEWTVRTADSVRLGMISVDTLWYHLPVAARFAESGWTSHLHFVDGSSLTVFYPATSDLVHGLGIVFFGNDTLSPLLNLGWLALALLAAWSIGRPFGCAPLTLMGVALLLATPLLVRTNGGEGLNDVMGLALWLAAVAVLVSATRNPREHLSAAALGCAALAAGLALGTKYTLIPPVGALSVGVALIGARGERVRRAVQWFAVTALTGGYWYVRNLVAVGNPLPTLHIGVGPVRLPSIPARGSESVGQYLLDSRVWHAYYLPGLRSAFGRAWWVMVVGATAGVAIGFLLGRARVIRMLALVAGVSFGAYLFGPQYLGFAGELVYFAANLRYAGPALALGAVVLPVAAARFGRRSTYLLLVLYGCALAATQLDPGIWQRQRKFSGQPTDSPVSLAIGVTIGAGVLVAAVARLVLRSRATPDRSSRRGVRAAAIVVAVVACAGGFGFEREYLDHRYKNTYLLPQIYTWARDTHDTRIAIVGFFVQYPLYGKDSSNFVQYIALRHKDRTSSPITDCATWRRVLNEGRYRYVVASTRGFPYPGRQIPREALWTRSDPAARLLIHDAHSGRQAWLYRIDGRLDPARCEQVGP